MKKKNPHFKENKQRRHHGPKYQGHPVKEFIEEEEHVIVTWLKRISILTLGLLLIFLIISLSFPQDFLSSLIASETGTDDGREYKIRLDNGGAVIIDSRAYQQLLDKYLSNQKTEIKACLTGTKQNNNYIVTRVYFPKVHSHSFNSVSAELCNEQTIIDLHSHPYRSCIFSEQDERFLSHIKKINRDVIMGLMCERDRFNFMGYD